MSTEWPICPAEKVRIDFLNHQITVHPVAVDAFRLVELRAWRTQYGVWLSSKDRLTTPTGGFNCRNRRPFPETPVTVDRHSEHCHGHTIDVNWDDNPLSEEGVLQADFDRFGFDDGCDWLACWLEPPSELPVFFRWGGGWTTDMKQACVNLENNGRQIRTGVVDGMHFELALKPAEVRRYDWQREIEQEEAMNKELEKLLAQASGIRAAVTFTSELTNALKRPGQEAATPAGAAKRVAKTVTDAERADTSV